MKKNKNDNSEQSKDLIEDKPEYPKVVWPKYPFLYGQFKVILYDLPHFEVQEYNLNQDDFDMIKTYAPEVFNKNGTINIQLLGALLMSKCNMQLNDLRELSWHDILSLIAVRPNINTDNENSDDGKLDSEHSGGVVIDNNKRKKRPKVENAVRLVWSNNSHLKKEKLTSEENSEFIIKVKNVLGDVNYSEDSISVAKSRILAEEKAKNKKTL